MAVEIKKRGKVLATVNSINKGSVTIPSANPKVKFPKKAPVEKKKGGGFSAELKRRAEAYIAQRKAANATRRSCAFKVLKTAAARRVYVKDLTKQTKRSMLNPKDNGKKRNPVSKAHEKKMMEIVHQLRIDALNKRRIEQAKGTPKEGKVKPLPYEKVPHVYLGKYAAETKKTAVLITNLPDSVTEEQLRSKLTGQLSSIEKIKVFEKTIRPKKKGAAATKVKRALLYTKGEGHAKGLINACAQKVFIDKKKAVFNLATPKRDPPTAEELAAAKTAKAAKVAKVKALKSRNHEKHQANQIRESRKSGMRRYPKTWSKKIIRDKEGNVVHIVRNPAARSVQVLRKPLQGMKSHKARVRMTRH